MSRLPACHGGGGHAVAHVSPRERREERAAARHRNTDNADIRPWIQVGEAAELALSAIEQKMREAE
jgi:hypothetical protein